MKNRPGKIICGGDASRRLFLKWGVASAVGIAARPSLARSSLAAPERGLALYNIHTGESLQAVYWAQGSYIPESMAEFSRILRDHRTDQVAPIDSHLFDLLYLLHSKLEARQPFHVISGYRSPASNATLVAHSSGVAKGSLHMRGQAVDISLPNRGLSTLRDAALALRGGGVGYYPASSFVHVDVGRVRSW